MPHPRLLYIALGSNAGDRPALLARAIEEMRRAGLRVLRRSSLYETEPVGGPPQGWFLNAVAEAETGLPAPSVLQMLRQIEQSLGRQRSVPLGPRTLDLDILFDGSTVITGGELEIPHPRLARRRFVLAPLAELAPDFMHPVLRKSVAQLLAELPEGETVRLWNPAGP